MGEKKNAALIAALEARVAELEEWVRDFEARVESARWGDDL